MKRGARTRKALSKVLMTFTSISVKIIASASVHSRLGGGRGGDGGGAACVPFYLLEQVLSIPCRSQKMAAISPTQPQ